VRILLKIVPLVLAVSGALSIGATAGAAPSLPSLEVTVLFAGTPSLSVEHVTANSGSGGGGVSLIGGGGGASPPPPARTVIDVPGGYTPDLTAPPGTPTGIAFVSSSGTSGSTVASTTIFGVITTADPAQYQNDPAAHACVAGPYLAVWKIDATILGVFKTSLPIFVVSQTTSPGVALVFCAPTLTNLDGTPVAAPPIPLDGVGLLLSGLTPPSAPGTYVWHAYVAPQTPGTGAPNDAATYELRAIVPVPHPLSVKGSYNAKLRDAVLTGKVTEEGKPQSRADVFVVSESSLEPIHARTNAAGKFTIRIRVAQTTTFFVQVPDQTERCQGPSTAPGGCASTTVSATATKRVRVTVPRR
jgi:hypothetical protein